MGADTFSVRAKGKTAADAFGKAVKDAAWENGHGGYTGTIAEKQDFLVLDANAEAGKVEAALKARYAHLTVAAQKKGAAEDSRMCKRMAELHAAGRYAEADALGKEHDALVRNRAAYDWVTDPVKLAACRKELQAQIRTLRLKRGFERANLIAGHLIDTNDRRIIDKWGPAGCIEALAGQFLFFGLASS
jgi:hypothetical protein